MAKQLLTEEQAIVAGVEMNERFAAMHEAEKERLLRKGGGFAEFRDAVKAEESIMESDGLEVSRKFAASEDYKITLQMANKFLADIKNGADEIVSAWKDPPPREDLVARISVLQRELKSGSADVGNVYASAVDRARAQGWKRPWNSPEAKKIELSYRPAIVALEKRISPQIWLYKAKLAQLDAPAGSKSLPPEPRLTERELPTDEDEDEPGAAR